MASLNPEYGSAARIQPTEEETPLLLPLTFLYRGLFIQLTLVIPVGLWWLKSPFSPRPLPWRYLE